MPHCYYCDKIRAVDTAYAGRRAAYDLGSEAPRCAWHWRLRCDGCRRPNHFMSLAWCPSRDVMTCRHCATASQDVAESFWAWPYRTELQCPCGEWHPTLDHAEFAGTHPGPERWVSKDTWLGRYPKDRLPQTAEDAVTDVDCEANWSANADVWVAGYDERGDRNRKYFSDPVLLRMLGDVSGQRVLDAGCGNGYLCRLLTAQGARPVGVELSKRFLELAGPGDYHEGSISDMPFLADASFDAVVSNYVLMDVRDYRKAIGEVARVLRPGGRFVYSISRNSMSFRWHWPAPDSPRPEDRDGWLDDGYFVRRAGYQQWGPFKPVLGFHRPLKDYIQACQACALTLVDVDEPEPSEEARATFKPHELEQMTRASYTWILRFDKPNPGGAGSQPARLTPRRNSPPKT